MKYRGKLYLGLITIALVSSLIGIAILYLEYKRVVIKDFKTKVLTAAVTTSALLNVEDLKKIQRPGDEKTQAYKNIRTALRKVRDSNMKSALSIAYIYTLLPDPKRPGRLMYGVDADENPLDIYPIGFPYEEEDEVQIVENSMQPWGSGEFIEDQYGVWFDATAPVYDLAGKYVATVGIFLTAQEVYNELNEVAIFGLLGLLAALIPALVVGFVLARTFTRSLESVCSSMKEISKGKLDTIAVAPTQDEFQDLAKEINQMTKGLKERERLKAGFSRYVSQHVLEKILKSETALKFEGERKKITILFSDIRQFTNLAETLPPEEVVAILNQYFERMIEVIFAHHGTLDKFIGDGLMVEFGAPLEDENQERNAVRAAYLMQEEVRLLDEKWEKLGKPSIRIGIGIHTGYAVVGNIGSEKRTEYTAIGDAVNVASRLEQATKTMNVPILVSETTYAATKDAFAFEDLGPISLPGRKEKIRAYALKSISNIDQVR